MKICINGLKKERVYFTTEYGVGRGIWKSKNSPVRKDYFVEFDIADTCCYEDISVSNFKQYRMESTEDRMCLTMLLMEYDEQGCASFRFGDSIVELDFCTSLSISKRNGQAFSFTLLMPTSSKNFSLSCSFHCP